MFCRRDFEIKICWGVCKAGMGHASATAVETLAVLCAHWHPGAVNNG